MRHDAEVAVGGARVAAGRPAEIDLHVDGHLLSGFGLGRVAINELVMVAERANLTSLTFADPVGPQTRWLRAYLDAIGRARRRTDLSLHAAVEVEVVRPDGWVAFPPDLGELEIVSVALMSLPLAGGPAAPARVRKLLAAGALRPADVVGIAVDATARALERTGRYAPIQLARPLSLLAEVGIGDADVFDDALRRLVAACRVTGAAVEVSEGWRRPSLPLARMLAREGVPLVAVSDSAEPSQVGRWRYVRAIQHGIAGLTGPAEPDCTLAGPGQAPPVDHRLSHDRGDAR
jgi:hypothetical protein